MKQKIYLIEIVCACNGKYRYLWIQREKDSEEIKDFGFIEAVQVF
jgi:hypothetical protein